MKRYNICQSCSMPMKKDPQSGGTNADGTKSNMYCSLCYGNGAFWNTDIDTPEKMRELVKGKLIEMGFPSFLTGFFTKGIHKLERWKN